MQIFTEVFQIPVFGAVYARLRGHSIACTLIPLAVLKPCKRFALTTKGFIACTLIPLAVLKLLFFIGELREFFDCMHPNTARGFRRGFRKLHKKRGSPTHLSQ